MRTVRALFFDSIGSGSFVGRSGYTIVELMVTIVIVAILAATVGVLFVKLLTIQEQEREEGYVRETLSDICAVYADFMSVGSSISNISASVNSDFIVTYRHEAGGVSLETGRVTHAAHLISREKVNDGTLDLGVEAFESGNLAPKFWRNLRGDASLIPLVGDQIRCGLTPLNTNVVEDAALARLTVTALYRIKDEDTIRTAIVERVVRLWNHE